MIDRDVRHRIVLRGMAIVHTTKRYETNKDNLGDVLLDLLVAALLLQQARLWVASQTPSTPEVL